MPCQAWFIVGPSNSTLDYDRHYIYAHSRWTIGTGRQAFAEILSSWPARRPFRRDERPCKRWVWLWRNSYPTPSTRKMSSTVSHIHNGTPPQRAHGPPVRFPFALSGHSGRTALAHLQGSVHSVQRCTLNGQRAPHARRGSAHFLEKREPLALRSYNATCGETRP